MFLNCAGKWKDMDILRPYKISRYKISDETDVIIVTGPTFTYRKQQIRGIARRDHAA